MKRGNRGKVSMTKTKPIHRGKITISIKNLSRNLSALKITREALSKDKLVYIARANKPIRYPFGKSKIAYIGQTSTGISRIAQSAAKKATEILKQQGFKHLDFYTIYPKAKKRIKTCKALERDLILTFRSAYGKVPIGNSQGSRLPPNRLSPYYRRERLEEIIRRYSI